MTEPGMGQALRILLRSHAEGENATPNTIV